MTQAEKLSMENLKECMKNEIKVYCPYSTLDLGWEALKNLQNITFEKPWYLKKNSNNTRKHE